ncbi:MAG: hypothetical protein AAFX80_10565 [Cyanobacteria bacterium J06639_18]
MPTHQQHHPSEGHVLNLVPELPLIELDVVSPQGQGFVDLAVADFKA